VFSFDDGSVQDYDVHAARLSRAEGSASPPAPANLLADMKYETLITQPLPLVLALTIAAAFKFRRSRVRFR